MRYHKRAWSPKVTPRARPVVMNGKPRIGVGSVEVDAERDLKPEKKPRPKSKREMGQLQAAVEGIRQARDWDAMEPKHFIGLYAKMHHMVYGVWPDEVRAQWRAACGAARRMLVNEFGQNKNAMVQYMRWAWNREKRREEKRGEGAGFRIGWRLMFGAALLVDYKVEISRIRRRKAQR